MRIALALAVCIITCTASAQSDRQLVDRYDNSVTAKNYKAALTTAQEITKRYPESSTWQFNLGSMHARLGNTEDAIEALSNAADLGYTGVRSFEQSEDLDPVRDDTRFVKALRKVQQNAANRLNEYIQEAKDHKPKTHIPANISDSPPLILALHGTGMRGQDMVNSLKDTADELNMVLIAPDALRPAQGGGFSWTYRDESEWMVNHIIQKAVIDHQIDPQQVYLVGFSQGANIALIMGQTHPETFAGVIPICGHYEPHTVSPDDNDALPPFYLMTGVRDPWKKTYAIAKRDFTKADAPAKVRVVPGIGHQIPPGKKGTIELVKAIKWCINQHQSSEESNQDDQTQPITQP